jgi:GAF domain-containing protein
LADQALLLQALRSFATTMKRSYDVTEVCYELCDRTVDVLSATGAGVSVADESEVLRFVTATDERIVAIEEIQESSQTGPCVMAYQSGQPVAISDIERHLPQFPVYRARATELQLRSVVGFPLVNNGRGVGALNLYNENPREWTEDDLDVLGVLADMATAFLVRVSAMLEARQLADQLQVALDSRVVIEQAKGILAGEHGISVDEAFTRLRNQSRRTNVKLTDLCRAVVDMGLRIPDK